MSILVVRIHPRMTVLQLKRHMKAQTQAAQQQAGAGADHTTAPAALRIDHASLLSLHADGFGALDDSEELAAFNIGTTAAAKDQTLFAFFLAPPAPAAAGTDADGDAAGSSRPSTPAAALAFDYSAVPASECIDLTIVFANTPQTPRRNSHSKAATAASSGANSQRQSRRASAKRMSGRNDPATVGASPSTPISGSNAVPASSTRPTSRPASGLSLPASTRDGLLPRPGTGGGSGTARTGEGDTARRFMDDDGDIASMSSMGVDEAEEARMQREMHGANQQQPEDMQDDQQDQDYPPHDDPAAAQPSYPHLTKAATTSLASAAGFVKGDLLDGYRLLQACRVDLPEEVTRATLSGGGSRSRPLVDAVPEHLAEFTNLSYLDVSGNNLPMDRMRLLPLLDELNLSANSIRDVDFAPILGIHYPATDDPAAAEAHARQNIGQWSFSELLGFPCLRHLDLSYNFLSQATIRILGALPRLQVLSLEGNDLKRFPRQRRRQGEEEGTEPPAYFARLTKLCLKKNRLGSGNARAKTRRVDRERSAFEVDTLAKGGGSGTRRGGGGALVGRTDQGKFKSSAAVRPLSALSVDDEGSAATDLLSEEEQEEEALFSEFDEDENEDADAFSGSFDARAHATAHRPSRRPRIPREYRPEFDLFRALAALPSLVELDLSDNLIRAIPAGTIPLAPAPAHQQRSFASTAAAVSFPKLQFLNLAWNELGPSEDSVLPLGDLLHLEWLDLRGNPFVTSRSLGATGAASSAGAGSNRARPNWALRFPTLYHVLVENCLINIVFTAPRYAGQNMMHDLSHMLRPNSQDATGAGGQVFEAGRIGGIGASLDAEAREARSRTSSAKQRAFRAGQIAASASSSQSSLGAKHSVSFLPRASAAAAATAAIEEKESVALAAQMSQQFGFSTAAEFAGQGQGQGQQEEQPRDSLQHFIAEQQRAHVAGTMQLASASARKSTTKPHPLSQPDEYAEAYDAYSNTFLTGVRAEDLAATPAFAGGAAAAGAADGSSSSSFSPSHGGGGNPNHHNQMVSRRATQAATATLSTLLAHSAVPVIQAAAPHKRHEATKRHNLGPPKPPRSYAPAPKVGLFGVRQPKVARVYAQMESVLSSIESAFQPGRSMQAHFLPVVSSSSSSSAQPSARTSGRSPNVRGVSSSAYIDASHSRTTDKLRALRHLEKEKHDVAALLRTVSEVSKVNALAGTQ